MNRMKEMFGKQNYMKLNIIVCFDICNTVANPHHGVKQGDIPRSITNTIVDLAAPQLDLALRELTNQNASMIGFDIG